MNRVRALYFVAQSHAWLARRRAFGALVLAALATKGFARVSRSARNTASYQAATMAALPVDWPAAISWPGRTVSTPRFVRRAGLARMMLSVSLGFGVVLSCMVFPAAPVLGLFWARGAVPVATLARVCTWRAHDRPFYANLGERLAFVTDYAQLRRRAKNCHIDRSNSDIRMFRYMRRMENA
jgi:hypothetical protein